jgi:hypothetical protein
MRWITRLPEASAVTEATWPLRHMYIKGHIGGRKEHQRNGMVSVIALYSGNLTEQT